MKRLIYIISLLFISSTFVHAEMVSYIDDKGKRHYVDTDYVKVPDKYYYQVKDKLEAKEEVIEQEEESDNKDQKDAATPVDTKIKLNQTVKVELLTTNDCSNCQRMGRLMRGNKIRFYRYDVQRNARGVKLYEKLGGGELPITIVDGDTIIPGLNVRAVLEAIRSASAKEKVEAEE